MGSEAPCCGGGLSGNCLRIIHFIFNFYQPPNPIVSSFSKILNIPLIFRTFNHPKDHPKILKKLLN